MAAFQARADVARAECLAQRKKERKKRRKAEEEAARKEEAVREGEGDCPWNVMACLMLYSCSSTEEGRRGTQEGGATKETRGRTRGGAASRLETRARDRGENSAQGEAGYGGDGKAARRETAATH